MRLVEGIEEWGDWVEHDGMGCPPQLLGRAAGIKSVLTYDDFEGASAGDTLTHTLLVTSDIAGLPDWLAFMAGKIVLCPIRHVKYGVPKITHYRTLQCAVLVEEMQGDLVDG